MIWNDVGQGDALQFCRYLPALERQGITVTLAVQPELIPLFEQLGPIQGPVISRDGQPWRKAERHLPLMGLPLAVDPDLRVGPHDLEPYFHLPPEQQSCPEALLKLPAGRRIGLCWASNPGDPSLYPIKSVSLGLLLETSWQLNDQLISLQRGELTSKEEHREQLAAVLPETADWVETARWINHCDLVITVDTAVAHLAGGLGRPVVVLLPWLPDWRWNYGERGKQWYRYCWTLRQPAGGDWRGAVARLGACVDEAIRSGSSASSTNG